MPAERTAMRHVREVLRLKFVGGVPTREIARRIGVAPSTVRTTIRRFQGCRAELAAARRNDRCRAGGEAVPRRRHEAGPAAAGRARDLSPGIPGMLLSIGNVRSTIVIFTK